MRETLGGACGSLCYSGKTLTWTAATCCLSQSACTQQHMRGGASLPERAWCVYVHRGRDFEKVLFCGEVLAFTHVAFSLRTGRRAGYMIGIYPKASGFRLEFFSFSSGRIFVSFPPCCMSLSPFPGPRGVYSTMCHCSGQGNVDPGRGSLLRPQRLCCVGLCGTFVCVFRGSYVVWCGEASRDHGGAPHWEEGTNYPDYMWPADW